ncbi:hypothetical protein I4U23_031498 [Adineta vaga]|nr:hypothetical protein I4U23_031498 [Adineta vaga]
MSLLKNYLRTLNFFEPKPNSDERESEQQRRWNIIATRIYLLILIIALIIVALISWMDSQTIIVTLEHPTEEQFKTLPIDVQCPCSQVSISYGDFTSIQTIFHPICSSTFISDEWIRTINSGSNATRFKQTDFRKYGSAYFQSLASFCRLSKLNVEQSIISLYLNTFLSPKVLMKTTLDSQTQSAIDQFQRTAPNSFASQLQLIRQTTRDNDLISGLQSNKYLEYSSLTDRFVVSIPLGTSSNPNYPPCNCISSIDCILPSQIVNSFNGLKIDFNEGNILMEIPGFVWSCLPVNGILFSTLECLYNQTCLDELTSYFTTTNQFLAMKEIHNSDFTANSTVKSMIDVLMVEKWTSIISYEKYYAQCAPILCTYLTIQRHSVLFVLTRLIGILSGLTLILGLMIPIIVSFIRRRLYPEPSPRIALFDHLRQLKIKLLKILIELNIFKRYPSNDRQICFQLIKVNYLSIIHNPTVFEYNQLEQIYSDSLSCPCSSISTNYSTFITIEPHYHQLCLSDFVTPQWIKYFFSVNDAEVFFGDYRITALSHFQSLITFCQQAQQTINNSLGIFFQTEYISPHVVSQQILVSEMNVLINDWKLTTLNQFVYTIQLIGTITQGNQLANSGVNFDLVAYADSLNVTIEPKVSSNCSCALSSTCRFVIGIYNYNASSTDLIELYQVPNFFRSCYLVEALLESTLECFYSLRCMKKIDEYISGGTQFNFSALSKTRNSPYEKVESIINKLMVDSWSWNVAFASYYNSCAPASCTFEYVRRNNLFFIVTTITGAFGGLSLGFQLIILIILRVIEKLIEDSSHISMMHFIRRLFSCQDEHQLIRRLHFILVIISLFILYLFSAFKTEIMTVEVKKPLLSDYQDLIRRFPDSVQCSCSQISITYHTFLNITPRFHKVCSSVFVSKTWIEYLYNPGKLSRRYDYTDFLYSATAQFQLLASLCQLSQQAVNESISQLIQSNFINSQLLSPILFNKRIQKVITQFQMAIPRLFLSILSLIRETTGANMIITTFSTSWVLDTSSTTSNNLRINTAPLIYNGCSCSVSAKCVQPSRNMLAGCYPLEALLQTTLKCLYNQECIDSSRTFKAMILSSSNPSRFNINSTIELIMNELMVEQYLSNIYFEDYFTQCAPLSCTYSYIVKSNLIDGMTSLISLYGGLVIICRVLAVLIIKQFRRQTIRINPHY